MSQSDPRAEAAPSPPTEPMATLEIRKGPDAELRAGGLRFVACRREIGEIDGGISLYVWSAGGEQPQELLRFDLFRTRPHYHAPAESQAETKIPTTGAEAARAWGIEALTRRAPEYVVQAGFPAVAEALDTAALAALGPELEGLFAGLGEPDELSYFEVPQSLLDRLNA